MSQTTSTILTSSPCPRRPTCLIRSSIQTIFRRGRINRVCQPAAYCYPIRTKRCRPSMNVKSILSATDLYDKLDSSFFRPSIDRTLKPTVSSESLMEGLLRQILVPQDTMSKFLALASKNTANNIETCGILAGRLAYNRLNITHVIVPKQNGTADSCITMNEEDIFDIQDQQNLITLGWIHVSWRLFAFELVIIPRRDQHFHSISDASKSNGVPVIGWPSHTLFVPNNDAGGNRHCLCSKIPNVSRSCCPLNYENLINAVFLLIFQNRFLLFNARIWS